MTKVFIDGSAGTTGLRIHERLSERKDLELLILSDELRKDANARREMFAQADIAFLCLPDAAAIEAVELAKDADIIVLGMCSGIIFRGQKPLYDALNALGKKMVVVAMESPCDLELVPDCRNYIATYGAARDWMRTAARRMFGLTDINAKPAIHIPDAE